jgi:hypothetical protein
LKRVWSNSLQKAALATALLFLSACSSSDSGQLQMVSYEDHRSFTQKFTQAYIARNATGDADIVLVQDDMQSVPQNRDPSKPLEPDPCDLPRQLVHIRVFWTPMPGVKPDHPANTNASIHWTLVCDHSQGAVIDYSGCGLVELSESKTTADISIRGAWMKADRKSPSMIDPLGASNLQGSFTAVKDPEKVQAVMAEIKSANAVAAEAEAQAVAPLNPYHY